MYKPANIREFVTPAIQKRVTYSTVNGRQQKTFTTVAVLRGKFKQKGTRELDANGLTIVHTKTEFITWWKSDFDFQASDKLTIGGVDYKVHGQPENVEMRGRYAVLTLELYEGGA